MKVTNPVTGVTTVLDPPGQDSAVNRVVYGVTARGFKVKFTNAFSHGPSGFGDIECTFAPDGESFNCTDVVPNFLTPEGAVWDGHNLPSGAPRAFDAVIFQTTKYVGTITSQAEYSSVETLHTWCEGVDAECAGLTAYVNELTAPDGGLAPDGLVVEKRNKRVN